jgi:DNA-binding protein HU-beta
MNRRELTAALSERLDTDKRKADEALQSVLDVITETVSKGEAVAISGFAKFARRDVPAKPARMGRNPATGEEMMLAPKAASRSVKITPLKAFKDAVITGKRAPAKKAPAKKAAVKSTTAKSATIKKSLAKSTTVKKAAAKKSTAKKTTAKKTTAKKSAAKKTTAKKTTAKKAGPRR